MISVRTCVACRKRASRSDLLRVVSRNGKLIADDRAVLPGRGAWVHPSGQCLKKAVQRGSFIRALNVLGNPDTCHLENRLEKTMDK